MTRLENENKAPNQLGEMQDEIQQLKKQLKHKQSKKFLNCTSCSVILILVFIVLGAVLALVMAKSGLWQLPFFSDYFYHAPQPVYQVADSSFSEADLLSRLRQNATNEALKQKKSSNLSLSLDLTESELTALLLVQAKKNPELAQNIESGQIALTPTSAQLFLKAKSPKNLIVTLDFVPEIKDNKLNLAVKDFKVGNLSLPGFLGELLVENMLSDTLNTLLSSMSLLGKLESITLAEHKLKAGIFINNLKF